MRFAVVSVDEDPSNPGFLLIRGKFNDVPQVLEMTIAGAYELLSGIEAAVLRVHDRNGGGEKTALGFDPEL